jgi:hypothetical protein
MPYIYFLSSGFGGDKNENKGKKKKITLSNDESGTSSGVVTNTDALDYLYSESTEDSVPNLVEDVDVETPAEIAKKQLDTVKGELEQATARMEQLSSTGDQLVFGTVEEGLTKLIFQLDDIKTDGHPETQALRTNLLSHVQTSLKKLRGMKTNPGNSLEILEESLEILEEPVVKAPIEIIDLTIDDDDECITTHTNDKPVLPEDLITLDLNSKHVDYSDLNTPGSNQTSLTQDTTVDTQTTAETQTTQILENTVESTLVATLNSYTEEVTQTEPSRVVSENDDTQIFKVEKDTQTLDSDLSLQVLRDENTDYDSQIIKQEKYPQMSRTADTQKMKVNVATQVSVNDCDTQTSQENVDTQTADTQTVKVDIASQKSVNDGDTQPSQEKIDTQLSRTVDTQTMEVDVVSQKTVNDCDAQTNKEKIDIQLPRTTDTQTMEVDVASQTLVNSKPTRVVRDSLMSVTIDTQTLESDFSQTDTETSKVNIDTQISLTADVQNMEIDSQMSMSVDIIENSQEVDIPMSVCDDTAEHTQKMEIDVANQIPSNDVTADHTQEIEGDAAQILANNNVEANCSAHLSMNGSIEEHTHTESTSEHADEKSKNIERDPNTTQDNDSIFSCETTVDDVVASGNLDNTKDEEEAGPVQLLRQDQQGKFSLNQEALSRVLANVQHHKLAIISIVGAFRRGKSFLLNFLLRYLKAGVRFFFSFNNC